MSRTCFTCVLLLLAGGCQGAQGDGMSESEVRSVSEPFDRILVRSGLAVDIEVAPGQAEIEVAGDANLLPRIRTRIADGVLTVQSGDIRPVAETFVRVRVPSLRGVSGSGEGSAVWVRAIDCDPEAEPLVVNLQRGAEGELQGVCNEVAVIVTGRSVLGAFDLATRRARVRAMERAVLELQVSGSLEVEASGVSVVRVQGDPVVSSTLFGDAELRLE